MCASLLIITIKSQHKVINRSNAAKVLEKSLKEAGVSFHNEKLFENWTAHHIVAYEADAANYSREVLEALDIDINSAANGVFLPRDPSKEDVISESKHNGGHTLDYFTYVNKKIKDSLVSYDSAFESNDYIENTFKSLDLDELNEVRGIICNTLLDIKVELLNGDLKIHRT